MTTLCTLTIRQSANSSQLKALRELLALWSDEVLDDGLCLPQVDKQAADDLEAGELPQPEYLRFTGLFHDMNKLSDMIGLPKTELGEFEYKQLKVDMGENACQRAIPILIEPLSEGGPDDVSEAIDRLQSRLTYEIVEL